MSKLQNSGLEFVVASLRLFVKPFPVQDKVDALSGYGSLVCLYTLLHMSSQKCDIVWKVSAGPHCEQSTVTPFIDNSVGFE